MLEVIVSILYFLNKVLLLFNKRSGWIIGAVASGTAIFYFFGLQLYIFFALEIACFFIMVYGALGKQNSKRFAIYVYGLCAIVTAYLCFSIQETGILEFLTSILFMAAFVQLANNKRRLGWLILGLAHGIMAMLTYGKAQYFFSSIQIASVVVCAIGIMYPALLLSSKANPPQELP